MKDKNMDMTLLAFDSDYERLVSNICSHWDHAKSKAISAINTELLEANWQIGDILWNLSRKARKEHNMVSNFWSIYQRI